MGITLTYDTTVVNLPNPSQPYKAYKVPKQKMNEAEDGTRYVYNFGVNRRIFELTWNVIVQSDFNQLQSFIENTVNFMETPFTYTDMNGVNYNVRATVFGYSQISALHYQVTLKLEEEV